MLSDQVQSLPSPHVCEQPLRQGNRRLPFIRLRFSLGEPIEYAALQIHIRPADRSIGRCRCNRTGARTGVLPDQDKAGDVSQPAFCRCDFLPFIFSTMNGLQFSVTPARPNLRCRFRSRQPPIARQSSCRQPHPNAAAVQAFLRMVIDRCAKVFQITTRATIVSSALRIFAAGLAAHHRQLL